MSTSVSGPFDDRGQVVADVHVLPVARLRSAYLLVRVRGGDLGHLLLRVEDVAVLGRRLALLLGAPVVVLDPLAAAGSGHAQHLRDGASDELAAGILEQRLALLDDEARGAPSRLLLDVDQPRSCRDAIADPHRPEQLPVGAAVDPLDAGKPGPDDRGVDREQERGRSDHLAPRRPLRVLLVAPQRVVVADAVDRPAADVVQRDRLVDGRPVDVAAQPAAHQLARARERVVGQAGSVGLHAGLGLSAHRDPPSSPIGALRPLHMCPFPSRTPSTG